MEPSSSTSTENPEEDLTVFKAPISEWSSEKTLNWLRTLGYGEDMIKRSYDYSVDGQALYLWDLNGDFVTQFAEVFDVPREEAEEISRRIRLLTPTIRPKRLTEQEEDFTEFTPPMYEWSYEKTMCWFRSLGHGEEFIRKFDDYNVDGQALVHWNEKANFIDQFTKIFSVEREQAAEISRLTKQITSMPRVPKVLGVITLD